VELARYCIDLVQEAYQFLGQKEVEKVVYKDKSVSKSIDKAAFWVVIIEEFEMCVSCFIGYGSP
ncbi:hypothetical protein, partial [Treponema sp.]|uniref:hypothetical protein n=1 Tax=Treponema sp. TaxID=166 RepID=UPI00298E9444